MIFERSSSVSPFFFTPRLIFRANRVPRVFNKVVLEDHGMILYDSLQKDLQIPVQIDAVSINKILNMPDNCQKEPKI